MHRNFRIRDSKYTGMNKSNFTMKKFLLIAIILISCQNKTVKEKQRLDENLFTYFKENIRTADSTIHLDSVRILKFDTITANTILYQKTMILYDGIEDNQKKFNELKESQNSDAQMIRLTAGSDNPLYENSRDEYVKKMKEMRLITDEIKTMMQKADSLSDLLHKSDTTTLVYLQVKCLIQYQRKDLSVKRDTGFVFLSPEKSIVRKEDVFK